LKQKQEEAMRIQEEAKQIEKQKEIEEMLRGD